MTAQSEHWLDRLATPHTRRQGLKAALAGLVLTLPLMRTVERASAATDPSACQKGCIWTANQTFYREAEACRAQLAREHPFSRYFGPVLGRVSNACIDRAVATRNISLASCNQPFCPGFNPAAPGGPCDSCTGSLSCNPCPDVESGYICCIYGPDDCHGDCCPSHTAPGCP